MTVGYSTICADYGQFGQHVMNPLLEPQQCVVGRLSRYFWYLTSDASEVSNNDLHNLTVLSRRRGLQVQSTSASQTESP